MCTWDKFGCTGAYLGVFGCVCIYLGVFGYIRVFWAAAYLQFKCRVKSLNTMINIHFTWQISSEHTYTNWNDTSTLSLHIYKEAQNIHVHKTYQNMAYNTSAFS